MSDEQACKSEDQHRIDTLEELTNAERELRSAKTRFEQAQWEVVKAAETLLEWRENWSRLRKAALSCYPAAVPVERVLEDAQATIDRFCAEVNARNADLDKAISALTPEDKGGLLDPVPSPPDESSPQASGEAAKTEEEIVAYFEQMPDDQFAAMQAHIERTEAERTSVVTDQDRVEQTSPPVPAVEIPEGFIPWSGGECPVDRDALVEVMYGDRAIDRSRAWRLSGEGNEFAGDHWQRKHSDLPYPSMSDIIAYKVISEPAEASEPAEIISTLTGDPESGLHGEQSQSEPITNPDASFWTAGFEEDRKPKLGFIEGAVSKLFGVKEPA